MTIDRAGASSARDALASNAGPAAAGPAAVPGAVADRPRDLGALRAFRAVGLVFVAIPLINILTTGADAVSVVLGLAGAATFVAILAVNTRVPGPAGGDDTLFGVGPRIPPKQAGRVIAATSGGVVLLLAIAVVDSLHRPDAGWFAFFYFASTAASTIWHRRIAIGLMSASGIVAGLTFFAVNGDAGGAVVQGLSVSVIGLTVFSAIVVRRTNRELVEARHELARLAVADERSRIARDLHDTLGHSLSVIALKSELAARLIDEDPARARAEMEDVQRVARDSLGAVRETIGGYRQASLATELAGARSALEAAGIHGRVEPAPEGLPPATDAILGWAVREGVTNILRHGRAGAAEIRVEQDPAAVSVEIRNDRDPGRDGSHPEGAPAGGPGGMGLAGLRERVAIVGGVVEAGGLPDGGFRLRVSIPIA